MLRLTGETGGKGTEMIAWQPYSDAALRGGQAAGRIVMVEFTANWCPNCLELEARVFHDPRAAAAIRADMCSPSARPHRRIRTRLEAAKPPQRQRRHSPYGDLCAWAKHADRADQHVHDGEFRRNAGTSEED